MANQEMGEVARKRREELGLTMPALCGILGITTNRLRQMEAEGVEGLSTITRWANALGMDPVDLAFPTRPRSSKKGKKQ
jgi:transcriptional regulator with XRE-family HTH domain